MINLFLISLIFPFLAFIFEIYPRLFNRNFGVDIWTHLLYLREYHKQKGIPKEISNGFLVSGDYDYPPVFITILSKFPIKLVERYEFLFSPFFDLIHLIIIFFITYYLTNSLFISVLTQILYMLTPIIILENSSATPRSLGYTLFTLVFFLIFLFIKDENIVFVILAIISGSLIFLSHRFTTQGLLFFSIAFSFLDINPIYIIVFISSFLLAIILSKGFYLKVIQGHIGNLIFWYKNIQYRFAHQVKGNYKDYKTKDFIFNLYNQFLRFPPFVFTITNPWTITSFLYFIFFTKERIITQMGWIIILSYIIALLTTWVKQFRFLGEGQRYLELSAFPSALLSSLLLSNFVKTKYSYLILIGFIVVGISAFITTIIIQRKAIIKDTLRTVTPSMKQMFIYLRSLKEKPRLLCIPHQITTNTIYHTKCPVFVNANYTDMQKIADVYPYLRRSIKEVLKKYNLDMILLNEKYAKVTDLKIRYKIIKKIENFLLVKPL